MGRSGWWVGVVGGLLLMVCGSWIMRYYYAEERGPSGALYERTIRILGVAPSPPAIGTGPNLGDEHKTLLGLGGLLTTLGFVGAAIGLASRLSPSHFP